MGNKLFGVRLANALMVMVAVSTLAWARPAAAVSLTGANGSATSGVATGNYLFTFYDLGTPVNSGGPTVKGPFDFAPSDGDSVIRLLDPNGCGNGGVSGVACTSETDLCAMIYVFDDDQEMGECCGCPITPNGLNTYSVRNQLVNNWALSTESNTSGTIVVIGAAVNDPGSSQSGNLGLTASDTNGCGNLKNPACYGGCDPTLTLVTTGASNLDGSITHDQEIIPGNVNLTEVPLFDQGAGETINNAYLVAQCGALIGNGSRAQGFCFCDPEEALEITQQF